MVRWLDRLAAWVAAQEWQQKVHIFTASDVPSDIACEWGETLPAYVLHMPLAGARKGMFGGLLLMAETPWVEAHLALAGLLGDAYGHAWQALAAPERVRVVANHFKHYWRRYAIAFVILCLLPTRQYVLSPAEVVPDKPAVIAAPLSGVVGQVEVQANQVVKKGQLLFVFEDTELANRLSVAQRAFDVAEAEYQKNVQESFSCESCRAQVAQSQAVMERERAQVDWARAQLAQGEVRAPRDGVVVFGEASDWVGRPVRVGERIMLIADSAHTRLRITVPVTDAIATENGTRVIFYPNVSPLSSVDGKVIASSYEPTVLPDRSLAYVLQASFEESGAQLGWRGTAKIYGSRAPLIYQMLRKPLSRMRQLFGI
jgi:multidrug resistance efflux pump